MLGRHLIDRDGVGLGTGDEVDVMPGQPAVWVNVSTDAPLDMGEAGKYGKMITMMGK